MTTVTSRLDRFGHIFLAATIAFALLVPVLALTVPKDSTFAIPPYVVALLGKYICLRFWPWRWILCGDIAGSCLWAMARSSRLADTQWECI